MFGQLLLALAVLVYLTFSITTMYLCFIGKKSTNADLVGRLIWYHGIAWIVGMIAVVVITMAFLFANIILNVIHLRVFIG